MRYLNQAQLSEKLGGRSRAPTNRDVEAKILPAPIKIGGRNYWIESEVDDAISAVRQMKAA